jgi:uncharacterized protein
MPTNLIRKRAVAGANKSSRKSGPKKSARRVAIRAGRVTICADLLETLTAERIWAALPLHSTAEIWGRSVHFETPLESGREGAAITVAEPGDIAFWCERDRIIIVFGPTPMSRGGNLRLPTPCNIWAKTQDDVTLLMSVVPGEKVSLTAI